MKIVPLALEKTLPAQQQVRFSGGLFLSSCLTASVYTGSAVTAQHQLLFLVSGTTTIRAESAEGIHTLSITPGQAILFRKGTSYHFEKCAHGGQDYNSVLFFIQQDFISSLLPTAAEPAQEPIKLVPQHPLLTGFMTSLVPYFDSPLANDVALLELKTREFMHILLATYPHLVPLLANNQVGKLPLAEVMERHFTQHGLTLPLLADLSGRSLATFKRDFKATFGVAPAQWLLQRRLTHALHLLQTTAQPVADVAYAAGFEDHSHFARVFRTRFSTAPSAYRMSQIA